MPARTLGAVRVREAPAQIHNVVLQHHLHALLQGVFQRQHRRARHAPAQRLGQANAPDQPAFVLDKDRAGALGQLEQGDGQGVFEIDLRRLRFEKPTEARTAMARQRLEIDGPRQRGDQARLAGAGGAGDHVQLGARCERLKRVDQKATHGFVAPRDARVSHARLGQPVLHDSRAQPAAKTVQIALGTLAGKVAPGGDTGLARGARYQFMAQRQRRGRPRLLVAGAHRGALLVRHQRQVGGVGEGAAGKFHGCACVQQRGVGEKHARVVRGVLPGAGHTRALIECRTASRSGRGALCGVRVICALVDYRPALPCPRRGPCSARVLAAEEGDKAILKGRKRRRHQGKVRVEPGQAIFVADFLVFFD